LNRMRTVQEQLDELRDESIVLIDEAD
jgi:hypothetical protein